MAETEMQSKLGTVLGYREKCITKALYQMRGKTQPIAFVRKPYLGKPKLATLLRYRENPNYSGW